MPEFLNRFNDIIVFHYPELEHLSAIAEMFVAELIERLQGNEIHLVVNDEVTRKLAKDGFDPVYGARPLRREVERQVENPLAMKIVTGEVNKHDRVQFALTDGKIYFRVTPA